MGVELVKTTRCRNWWPFEIVFLPVLCLFFHLPNAIQAAETRPPNVVVIFIDDMGYADIGPFGAEGYETPNLDRMAKEGRPFLMNVQSNEVTRQRMDLYRQTMRDEGHDEALIAKNVDETWVWRNIFVAETDEEAEKIGTAHFIEQFENRAAMRERVLKEQGVIMQRDDPMVARNQPEHGLICGSPATVAEKFAAIDKIGVGGVLMTFRMGFMPDEAARSSLTLFMEKVAPEFQKTNAAA